MSISTRHSNNPNVRRAQTSARTGNADTERARHDAAQRLADILCEQQWIDANARRIAEIERALSRHELDRIARLEAYERTHANDNAPSETTEQYATRHGWVKTAPGTYIQRDIAP